MFDLIRKWVSEIVGSDGQAVHCVKGKHHAVAIKAMRVVVVNDGDYWYAQSLDIDYAASGMSIDSVKQNFESGLSATIKAHLQKYGSIDRIMKSPDLEDWVHLFTDSDAEHYSFSMGESHLLADHSLPFEKISYIQGLQKAA